MHVRLTLLTALLLTACAPAASQTAAPAPAASGPKMAANQELTVGINSMVATWDPFISLGSNARRYGTYETLIAQKDDGTMIPGLASKWEMVNPTTWRGTLVQGRTFHDGSPVTVDDVVWTVQRAVDPVKKYTILGRIGLVNGAKKIDNTTVEITTSAPDALINSRIGAISILPQKYFERVGDKEFENKPVGSGPFKVQEWVTQDRVVLVPFTEHPNPPKLKKLTVRVIPEAAARIAGMRTGDLDLINQVPFDNVETLKSAGIEVVPFDTGNSWGAWMDTLLPDSPTKDTRVRQAINYAIDKETLVKTVYKGLTIPDQGQIIQKETFGFNPNLKPYPYDPAKAKQLIAAAGYPNGFKIKIDAYMFNAEARQVWPYVQQQLKEVGIEADMNTYSDSANNSDRFYGRVQRAPITGVSVTNVPAADADFAIAWFSNDQEGGAKRYDNAEFQRWYNLARNEFDEKKRLEYLQKAVEVMYNDPPYLFLVQGSVLWVHSPKTAGFVKRVDADPDFNIIFKAA